jgi:hypothetical protein
VGLKKNQQPEGRSKSAAEKGGREQKNNFQCQEVGSSSGPIILRAEVIDCEPELKEQVPEEQQAPVKTVLAG